MSLRQWSIRRRILLVGTVPALIVVLLLTTYHMVNRWSDIRKENQSIARIVCYSGIPDYFRQLRITLPFGSRRIIATSDCLDPDSRRCRAGIAG